MVKKIIGILMIVLGLIMLIPIVHAAPPFQQVAGTDEGLDLRFPPVETIKIGRDVTAHMHVYNNSNGLILDNTTVSCRADLYNSTGFIAL